MVLFFRILIGSLFVVSGAEKLIWPWQNFLYVLQSYQYLPSGVDIFIARVFPWAEFLTGLCLLLGLWLKPSFKMALAMFCVFILSIVQAFLRHLPLEDCGCFGALISLKPQHTLLMDSFLFLSIIWVLKNVKGAERFSLDRYFAR